MNVHGIVLLGALLAVAGFRAVVALLDLGHGPDAPPEELAGVIDAEEYRRSRKYKGARTRFGLLRSGFDLTILLVFWLAGGFGALDAWLRQFDLGRVGTGLVFIGALALARTILDLPWSAWGTFVLEERFGFNRQGPWTFLLDRLKAMGLSVALGGPLLAAVLWFFQSTDPLAWMGAWITVTVFGLLLQYVGPRYLMPIFNDFERVEDEDLREAILAYAAAVDFCIDELFVMDASRRSAKSNALFAGFGRHRRVILFDTLVERHSVEELVAVVAHEVGHYKLRHIPWRVAFGIAHTGALFLLLGISLRVEGLYEAFFVDGTPVHVGLVLFGIAYSPVEQLLSIPLNAWSRRHEFQADRFAAETTGRPGAMIDALKKLVVDNLSDLAPHPLRVRLDYSHPPVRERIEALESLADGSGSPG